MKGYRQIIDLSNPRERQNLINDIRARSGPHTVEVRQYRPLRTTAQNAYLWGVVYPAFVDFRQEQGEDFDAAMAHEFFSLKFRRQTVIDQRTGEVLGTTVPSSTTMDVGEMSVFIEKVIAWLADYGIVVPPAAEPAQPKRKKVA